MGVCMNLTTINCTLFVVITYFLTCIIAWCLPFKDITLLTTFVPASVAILLTIYNKQKVRDLFKLSSPKNCLLGFILILVSMLISNGLLSIYCGFSFFRESFTLDRVKDLSAVLSPLVMLFVLLSTFVMWIIMSLGEEIGWRGYLLKNLKSKISNFYIRAIIVGIIWSVWNIPTYVVAGSALWKDGFTFPTICAYTLYICAMSIMFTWLFEKDNSIWPVTIAHATNNLVYSVLSILMPSPPLSTFDAVIRLTLGAAGYFIVAIGVIWFDKARERHLSNS